MRKIILDTDIGDDIDDALALALVLNSPELELVGITTVFLNSIRRAKLAARVLKTYGKTSVPICAGIDWPLIEPKQPLITEISGRSTASLDRNGRFVPCQFLPDMEDEQISRSDAVRFIVEAAHAAPGQIELVCIGPLTNAAVAIALDRELVTLLSGITLMGGMISEQVAEWNMRCDPEAASIVFGSGAKVRCVGLDVTLRCALENAEVDRIRRVGSEATNLIGTLVDRWLATYRTPRPILHDPLAVATLIEPGIVTWEQRFVRVGLCGAGRGAILSRKNAPSSAIDGIKAVLVASDVQREPFMKLFLERLSRGTR
jgi:purine nucleosidase